MKKILTRWKPPAPNVNKSIADTLSVFDQPRIEQYTVSAVGKERASGRPWFARIDLDPEQRGQGPCGHPLLHCHVGVDASDAGAQESRIPLPWLGPDEALAWLLATLSPRLEPK